MKKNNRRIIKYLVGGGIYIAAIVLIIIFGLIPKLSELTRNQNDLEKAKHELANTTDKRTTLEQLSKDKARIDLINSVTLEYLPQNPNSSDFVVKVEALAKQLNVIIGTFSFTEVKAETPKKTESEESTSSSKKSTDDSSSTTTKATQKTAPQNSSEFTMIISAEYGQILQFLEKMETFPRVNVVDSANVSGYTKEKSTMTLKVVGRIFYGN
jgi:Tfp pilus assembly protein PilO